MSDFLDKLAVDAANRIDEGYYDVNYKVKKQHASLKENIFKCKKAPIIAEIKFSSPSKGAIRKQSHVGIIAANIQKGGAVGLSVLTEPDNFDGSIHFLPKIRANTQLPILMKDVVLSPMQIDAGSRLGANAILLIAALFCRGYCRRSLYEMISYAHTKNLEVLLETHTYKEFVSTTSSEAELIGINNRNLKSLKVDLDVTRKILEKTKFDNKLVVSESGIERPDQVRLLHSFGAQAFLVGTGVMAAKNIKEKVRELVSAYEEDQS